MKSVSAVQRYLTHCRRSSVGVSVGASVGVADGGRCCGGIGMDCAQHGACALQVVAVRLCEAVGRARRGVDDVEARAVPGARVKWERPLIEGKGRTWSTA